MLSRRAIVGYVVALLVIGLDQWTKLLATTHLQYAVPLEILPVFNLTLQHNTGAAFSFLADAGGWQRWLLAGVSLLVSVLLVVWIARLQSHERLLVASLSLILGGALGNLWDRILLGHVVDFISVHYGGWFFPAFNIADSAITLGAGLMILDMLLDIRKQRADKTESEGDFKNYE